MKKNTLKKAYRSTDYSVVVPVEMTRIRQKGSLSMNYGK